MQSRWSDSEARRAIAHYGAQGVSETLALRVYTTRLLGGDPRLVLHGGGNTSAKTRLPDLLGVEADVLCVKGSGWDMAVIEPPGLPAVRLAPLLTLRARDRLSDEDMVRIQRANLIDPMAPNPSVETLLHAFLPHAFVDHTHTTALLSLIDQPDGEARARDLYGDRVGVVPYVMPGFALAKKAVDIYDADPSVEGLVLDKHGLFTFGADARESYERTIALVTLAEDAIARGRKSFKATALSEEPSPERGRSDREAIREGVAGDVRPPPRPSPFQGEGDAPAAPLVAIAPLADVAPIVRGACSLADEKIEGAWRRMVLDFRTSDRVLAFVNGEDVARYANAGVVTPDHTIRTKNWPLILPAPARDDIAEFRSATHAAASAFIDGYRAYFANHNARVGGGKRMLDPLPRVVLVPGLGLFGLGRSKREAKMVADLAEVAAETILDAEAIGRFEAIGEADMFDMEYWSLEQAKLGSAAEKPLAGQIALVTGAGGAIGAATAKAFAAAGAEVALLDRDFNAAQSAAKAIGGAALPVPCDVTDAASVREAFDTVVEHFGGVDIAISNAGAAWQGRIGEVDENVLRESFELNFYGHQRVAQNAARIMRAQGTGGCLLFNVSKQAVNPGPDFGPYGLPKAATLLLVRQYALEYGADGIRANGVNADRIRSGLLTDDFIAQRATARGVNETDYMRGNLLRREVTADDVAQAFLHQALQLKTTGDVTTVDGGNIAAALR